MSPTVLGESWIASRIAAGPQASQSSTERGNQSRTSQPNQCAAMPRTIRQTPSVQRVEGFTAFSLACRGIPVAARRGWDLRYGIAARVARALAAVAH